MRMLVDIVRQSLATLWAHKLRSFLTMFGIAWGVGSLLLLVGLGEGFRSGQERELATLGQNIMFMFPGRISAVIRSLGTGVLQVPPSDRHAAWPIGTLLPADPQLTNRSFT